MPTQNDLEAEIARLTKERDEIKSEASELAADLRRAMAEIERLRADIAAAWDALESYGYVSMTRDGNVLSEAINDALERAVAGAEQSLGDLNMAIDPKAFFAESKRLQEMLGCTRDQADILVAEKFWDGKVDENTEAHHIAHNALGQSA